MAQRTVKQERDKQLKRFLKLLSTFPEIWQVDGRSANKKLRQIAFEKLGQEMHTSGETLLTHRLQRSIECDIKSKMCRGITSGPQQVECIDKS